MKRLLLLPLLTGCQALPPPISAPSPSPSLLAAAPPRAPLPAEMRLTLDLKPPLKEWAALSPQCGLTLAPEGLYYVLPNCIQALRWEAIEQIDLDGTRLSIDVKQTDPVLHLDGIDLDSASSDYWTPRLPTHELRAELVRYAGLRPSSEGSYVRAAGKAQPPTQRRFIPLLQAGPPSLNLSPPRLARLEHGLGLFLNEDGVIAAEPTRVSSISWKKLANVEDRYDPEMGDPIVYLGLRPEANPGEYNAIVFLGPGQDQLIYLSAADYLRAAPLVKAKKAPARAQHFFFSTCLASLGEPHSEELPSDALQPVQAPAASDAWPGQALADLHPLASGVYLLPSGLFKVQPQIIEYAAWAEIKWCNIDLQGNATVYAHEGIHMEDHDLRRTPQMRALSAAVLEILRFQPDPEQRGDYRPLSAAPKPPQQGMFFALGPGKWEWPPIANLGQEPWKPGLHLQQDALVACFPNYLEVFLWEDLRGYQLERDELWLKNRQGSAKRFPSTPAGPPPALLKSAWSKLPDYWKATGKDINGEPEGEALPRHLRPAPVQHFVQP